MIENPNDTSQLYAGHAKKTQQLARKAGLSKQQLSELDELAQCLQNLYIFYKQKSLTHVKDTLGQIPQSFNLLIDQYIQLFTLSNILKSAILMAPIGAGMVTIRIAMNNFIKRAIAKAKPEQQSLLETCFKNMSTDINKIFSAEEVKDYGIQLNEGTISFSPDNIQKVIDHCKDALLTAPVINAVRHINRLTGALVSFTDIAANTGLSDYALHDLIGKGYQFFDELGNLIENTKNYGDKKIMFIGANKQSQEFLKNIERARAKQIRFMQFLSGTPRCRISYDVNEDSTRNVRIYEGKNLIDFKENLNAKEYQNLVEEIIAKNKELKKAREDVVRQYKHAKRIHPFDFRNILNKDNPGLPIELIQQLKETDGMHVINKRFIITENSYAERQYQIILYNFLDSKTENGVVKLK